MSITPDSFRTKFPEFVALTDEAITQLVSEAEEIHTVSDNAQFYLVAHLAALDHAERPTGQVAQVDDGGGAWMSMGIGPRRVSYKTQAEEERDVFYTRTPYGRRFLALERRRTAFTARAW